MKLKIRDVEACVAFLRAQQAKPFTRDGDELVTTMGSPSRRVTLADVANDNFEGKLDLVVQAARIHNHRLGHTFPTSTLQG